MVIGFKSIYRLIGVSIVVLCAVFVCNLFLNFNMDLKSIRGQITTEVSMNYYKAQKTMAQATCGVSGGCLLATSVVMLFFYIKNFIDSHKRELGILKAMGYSNKRISLDFWKFGLSVLIGGAVGYGSSFILMPLFYNMMNEENMLPKLSISFHFVLLLFLVIVPFIFFSLLSIWYANRKLRKPAISLLQNEDFIKVRKQKKETDLPFLTELRKSNLKQKPVLLFFIGFSIFCFSAMVQMSFSMNDLASSLSAIMIFTIGVLLAIVTLIIGITTVINSNKKNIAIMHACGYSMKDCSKALLSGYRIPAYIGFVVGTGYQFGLLKIMVGIFSKNVEGVPEYNFDVPAFFGTLAAFLVLYELAMYLYSRKIGKVSVKEIFLN